MVEIPQSAPSITPNAPVTQSATNQEVKEFNSLKTSLSAITSWGLSPDSWDKINIHYSEVGNLEQAKAALEMLK